jgi:tetratricopeptide (TPR) repeat protein
MFRSTRFPLAVAAAMSTLLVLSACGGAQSRMTAHMERGQKYYAEGNFEKARVEFRNALQIAPTDTEARFMNGQVAEKLGDLRGAAGLFQGALDQNPDHVGARANLARLYLFGGAASRAAELVEPGLAKHPDDAGLLTVRGAARVQLKDSAGALADAEHANRVAPNDENTVALLASLYRNGGDNQRAIDLVKKAVDKNPKGVDLHLVLANLYLTVEEPQSAIAEMKKVVELKPKDLAHRARLAMLYVRAKQPAEADQVMKDAVAALPDNNDAKLAYIDFVSSRATREKGEETLRQYIAQDPKNYDLQLGLGALQQRAGAQDKAVETYKAIIARDSDASAAVTARNRVAAIELARGKFDEAKRLIDQTLEKNPRDNDALVMRGNIALERGDTAGAISDLRAVLRDQPGSVPILRTLARAHLANGEPALAEESIRNAMEAAPADVSVRLELAQLLLQTDRGEQAVALMEETV